MHNAFNHASPELHRDRDSTVEELNGLDDRWTGVESFSNVDCAKRLDTQLMIENKYAAI